MTPLRFLPPDRAEEFHALFPLRPLEKLLFGGLTLEERWRSSLDDSSPSEKTFLLLNPLALPSEETAREISERGDERVWEREGVPLAARVRRERAERETSTWDSLLSNLPSSPGEGAPLVKPWDLIRRNGEQVIADGAALAAPGGLRPVGKPPHLCALAGEGGLFAGEGCDIEPFTLFDTTEGPIVLGRRVVVEANSVLRGPLWLRGDCRIARGASLAEGTTVGEGSRVGGEVEATLFGAFSNKQHDGFLGHAWVGEWVNLGAGTNNSDLKNNYGPVRIDYGAGTVETGELKLGCFLGDHVKTAIGTRIGTGAVVAPVSNLFGSTGWVVGYVPPFTWGERGDLYDFDRAVDTIERVRARRGRELERAGRPLRMEEWELRYLRDLWETRAGRKP